MAAVDTERAVQNRIVKLLCDVHHYEYIGNLEDVENEPIREETLKRFLTERQGVTPQQADEAIRILRNEAICHENKRLFEVNLAVYKRIKGAVPVSQGRGELKKQVMFIDWENPANNIFEIAEEVTVRRVTEDLAHRRPDVVVYINGIAVVVLELKKATVGIHEAIAQNWRNQQDGEIVSFFVTTQLMMAGNESEGLKYATIETPEKFWVKWKEPCGSPCKPSAFPPSAYPKLLDRSLLEMLEPIRLTRFIHDSVVFDGGHKKVMRPSQFFALEAAKPRIAKKKSGIIWHSQGAGKSLLMVWLAQWIRLVRPQARIVIVTDRDELDQQIKNGFVDAGQEVARAMSCNDLIQMLNGTYDHTDRNKKKANPKPDIICTLVHKFGIAGPEETVMSEDDKRLKGKRTMTQYLEEVVQKLPAGFKADGDFFVFVDECHRTQGGVLNRAMKKIMGEGVMMIGFSGTPLLRVKSDDLKLTSRQNFGDFIHTYKFDEAVKDEVVRDLRYEPRDVEQKLEDAEDFDEKFAGKTERLTPKAKERLKDRWAKLQHLFSSKERVERIARDICWDMGQKPALRDGWGNAMLIADSVYQAYRYWDVFQRTELKDHCAVVTSFDGKNVALSDEASSETATEASFKREMAKKMFGERTPEDFETWAKEEFVKHPDRMKLLIVVSKLITGFDAPAATYLYIDKHMEDQDLFQAICRVNRVNGDEKKFGYIIDYKNLFELISGAIEDYTNGGAFRNFDQKDVEGILKGRIAEGRKDLDAALVRCDRLCENVLPPKKIDEFFDFFCYDQRTTPAEDQQAAIIANANKREDFYEAIANLVRAFVAIEPSMSEAGYTPAESAAILERVKDYDKIRNALMMRANDLVDIRRYDAEMRSLLDDYVTAKHPKKIGELDDFSFLDLITVDGNGDPNGSAEGAEDELGGERGVAETIAARVRRVINRKRDANPAEYRLFSERINRLIEDYAQKRIEYKDYLKSVAEIAKELKAARAVDPRLDTKAKVSLFDNLGKDVELALKVDATIRENAKTGFRENRMRWDRLRNRVKEALEGTAYDVDDVMKIVAAQEEY